MGFRKEKAYVSNYEKSSSDKSQSAYKHRRATVGENLSFAAAEAYKLLRTNLMFSMADEGECRVIGVTSALRGEGKSTTAMNLAYTLAESGKKVLLIEGDMRIPIVAKTLQIADEPGLSAVLAGINKLEEGIKPSGLMDSLMVIPAGKIPPNPSELLSSARMQQIIEELSDSFDFIILDLPPVNAVSDALAVSGLLSGMIVVVRQNYCDQPALAYAMRQLEFMQVKLLGFVMNYSDPSGRGYKKYVSRYKYGYKYSKYYNYYYKSDAPYSARSASDVPEDADFPVKKR